MNTFACLFLAVSLSADPAPFGQLGRPDSSLHFAAQAPFAAYSPAPGDIVLSTTDNPKMSILYRLSLVGLPSHAGMVVRMPDGELGVFEAGGGGEFRTRTTPLEARFTRGGDKAVWIRKPTTPLTAEQESRLNEFAALSENKGYSKRRALELIPLFPHDTRGPIRTFFSGQPKGIRDDSVCSELIVEALVYAGLIPFDTARPSATSPRDLLLDRSTNLYIRRHPPLACGWIAPALWVPDVSPCCCMKPEPKRGLLRFVR